jgi:hypothetical protein
MLFQFEGQSRFSVVEEMRTNLHHRSSFETMRGVALLSQPAKPTARPEVNSRMRRFGAASGRRLSALSLGPAHYLKVPVLRHLAFGELLRGGGSTGVHRPLRVDPPDVDIWRTVEPAAGVRPRTGIATQRTPACRKQ